MRCAASAHALNAAPLSTTNDANRSASDSWFSGLPPEASLARTSLAAVSSTPCHRGSRLNTLAGHAGTVRTEPRRALLMV